MTDKQVKQIKAQLPEGEHLDRMYSAYEGGIRVISKRTSACLITLYRCKRSKETR